MCFSSYTSVFGLCQRILVRLLSVCCLHSVFGLRHCKLSVHSVTDQASSAFAVSLLSPFCVLASLAQTVSLLSVFCVRASSA
jgi:hypothetical protein